MQLGDSVSVSLQLLARLEARRCLKDIEPRLFPEDGGPDHGTTLGHMFKN